MARAGGPRVQELFDRARDAGSLGAVIFNGLGAIFFAIGGAIASGILTVADVIIIPLSALANAAGQMVNAIFGGAAFIIQIGAQTTGVSIQPGAMFDVGPFTFALGIGAVLLALYLVTAYVSEEPTGNFVPGLPFDIPTPGFGGPEEDDDEG
jgi:hypothetical protein